VIKNHSAVLAGAMLVMLPCAAAVGADAGAGQAMHEQHCIGCHDRLTNGEPTSLYTRENRLVTSLDGLQKQVRRCEQALELQWFDEDVDNMVEYLNQTYYHFEP
jgi:mono/diheme cytochrome c family protein